MLFGVIMAVFYWANIFAFSVSVSQVLGEIFTDASQSLPSNSAQFTMLTVFGGAFISYNIS